MMIRWVRRGAIAAGAAVLIGGILFGRELISYAGSSLGIVRTAVKDNVPVESSTTVGLLR